MLTRVQLEAVVLETVDLLRSGNRAEDDRVELKREWPEPSKARQLAGLLNNARGAPVIYIVGLDESGTIYPTSTRDVSDWWAQMSSRFEGMVPDLLHHMNVAVDSGQSLAVLLFGSDRAPYVVTSSGGTSELEVPLRDGTRTRSARRDELLRMLIPAITAPPAILLDASISGEWRRKNSSGKSDAVGQSQKTYLTGSVRVFLEHLGPSGIVLPVHGMRVELRSGGVEFEVPLSLWPGAKNDLPSPAFGVDVRHDGVAATGPGSFAARFSWSVEGDQRVQIQDVNDWTLRARFDVVGASRPIELDAILTRRRLGELRGNGENFEMLGSWSTS